MRRRHIWPKLNEIGVLSAAMETGFVMNNAIAQFRQSIPPPASPILAQGDWGVLERKFQTTFPPDYMEFVSLYGTGDFHNELFIYNYLDPRCLSLVDTFTEDYTFLHRQFVDIGLGPGAVRFLRPGELPVPVPIFPQPGGLLPWGEAPDGWHFCWRTAETPEHWGIVAFCENFGQIYPFLDFNFVEFLNELTVAPFLPRFRLTPPYYPVPEGG